MKSLRAKNKLTVLSALGLALALMATLPVRAEITIPTVTVGDVGNAADTTVMTTDSTTGYGGVSYIYNIGVTEVNLTQCTAFLNAVSATDTYNLYNTSMGTNLNIAGITRSGSSGSYTYAVLGSGNRPVTYVSWFDAARFANWVANGQPTGAQVATTTENGAYTLNGAVSGNLSISKNAINPNTSATTTWWLPSENEWYKAAYYQPAAQGGDSDSYWLYPTASNTIAGNTIGVADSANYYDVDYAKDQNSLASYLTDGGAYGSNSGSFYGTYDQGGNVWEWNDAVISGSSRGVRGGSWSGSVGYLQSSFRGNTTPPFENNNIGFRVASVPEPSTVLMVLIGLGGLRMLKRRKVTL